MDAIEKIRKELEGKKKPFIKEGKPIIYGPITGAVYFFNDRSGFVELNGNVVQLRRAIKEGSIDGKVERLHNMPIRSPNSDYDTDIPRGATLVPLCNGHVYSVEICSGRPKSWHKISSEDKYDLDLTHLV